MSTFPTSLDNLSESHADGTAEVIHASTINDLASAVNAVEAAAQFGLGIQYHDVQLNNAQILTLLASPVTLVPAPGLGLCILPLMVLALVDTRSGGYTGPGGIPALLSYVIGVATFHSNAVGNSLRTQVYWYAQDDMTDPFGQALYGFDPDDQVDAPMQLTNPHAGEYENGDPANTLSIRTWFSVVPAMPFGA